MAAAADRQGSGVETPEQAQTLYRLGYRYALGHHFSRPLTPLQMSALLERSRTTLPV
jgi:EAL domain-containing protein (putative c-di-GMP-specific phosphodiesterase class I)